MRFSCWLALLVSCLFLGDANRAKGEGATDTSAAKVTVDVAAIERERVLKAADLYLSEKPITVTASQSPRSKGGTHDYFSEGDYWWPDPKNPDGPYVQRDGESNPGNFNDHRLALIRLSIQVPALTAAFKLSGDGKYADHAVEHLVAWFVTPDTRLNPNLQYAQAVHGRFDGRPTGIIDTLHLVEVARAAAVLEERSAMSAADAKAIKQWFREYLTWMLTSEAGKTEGKAGNNHATCYWLQVASFAALVGDNDSLALCREKYKTQLLPQMAEDGSFPAELRRTKPYGYSLFNLDQLVSLCQLLSTPQDDLWSFALPTGQTIGKGCEYMYPFVKDKSAWPKKPDVMFYEFWPVRSTTWIFAGKALGKPQYVELWKVLEANPTNAEVIRNLPLRQPLLWMN